ncbi:MAG: hypothetical protein QXF76_03675 [Candidatus Anstonellales archaeon]
MLRKPFEYDNSDDEDIDLEEFTLDNSSKKKIEFKTKLFWAFIFLVVIVTIISLFSVANTLLTTSKVNVKGFKYLIPSRVSISSGPLGYYEAHIIITFQNRAGKSLVVYLADKENYNSILFKFLNTNSDCYLDTFKEFSVRDDYGNLILVGNNKITVPNGREITIIGTLKSPANFQPCSSAIGNYYRYHLNIVAEDEYGIILRDSGIIEGYFS